MLGGPYYNSTSANYQAGNFRVMIQKGKDVKAGKVWGLGAYHGQSDYAVTDESDNFFKQIIKNDNFTSNYDFELVDRDFQVNENGVPNSLKEKYSGYSKVYGYDPDIFSDGGSEIVFDKKENKITNTTTNDSKYFKVFSEDELSSKAKAILTKEKSELEGKQYFIIGVGNDISGCDEGVGRVHLRHDERYILCHPKGTRIVDHQCSVARNYLGILTRCVSSCGDEGYIHTAECIVVLQFFYLA